MKKKHKSYDPDFKRQTVDLADSSDRADRTIEEELGLYQGAIRTWRKELKKDNAHAFPGKGHRKPIEEENDALRRENEILRQERDILKKAAAIFSHVPRTGTHS
jgi:transposase